MAQREQTQQILAELKTLAKNNPKKFILDSLALLGEGKSFEDNQIIGNAKLNELGLHRLRVQWASYMAERRRAYLSHFVDQADAQQFLHQGFILKENYLPEHEFKALQKELLEQPLNAREMLQGDTVTRRMALDDVALKQRPVTQKLLNDQGWKSLLNYVASFDLQPMYYVQSIISHVRKSRPDPQTHLHSDTFHSSVKAWLFLTDVQEDEGPFVYAPGSHRVTEKRLQWEYEKSCEISKANDILTRRGSFRVTLQELETLGYNKPKAFAVKKNTLVIADTYGFHARGQSVRPSTRIELWAYARRNPFLPWVGMDIFKLPILNQKLVPIYWQGLDILEKRYQRHNPWKNVGQRYANESAVIRSK